MLQATLSTYSQVNFSFFKTGNCHFVIVNFTETPVTSGTLIYEQCGLTG